jgi:hypothetical protein
MHLSALRTRRAREGPDHPLAGSYLLDAASPAWCIAAHDPARHARPRSRRRARPAVDPAPRECRASPAAPRPRRDGNPQPDAHAGAGAGGPRLAPGLRPRLHRPRRAEGRLQGRGPLPPASGWRGGARAGGGPPAPGRPRAPPGHPPGCALAPPRRQWTGRPAPGRRHRGERARRPRGRGLGVRRAGAGRGRHLLGFLPPDGLPHRRLVRRPARPLGPRLDAGAPPAPRAVRPHVVAVAGPSHAARPGPRPRTGHRSRHDGLSSPPLPEDPHGVGRAAARADLPGPHAAVGGRGGCRAAALARAAARGPPRCPIAPRRRRNDRRLLGALALGRRVGPVPHGAALGGGQPLGPLPPLRDAQPRQGVRAGAVVATLAGAPVTVSRESAASPRRRDDGREPLGSWPCPSAWATS